MPGNREKKFMNRSVTLAALVLSLMSFEASAQCNSDGEYYEAIKTYKEWPLNKDITIEAAIYQDQGRDNINLGINLKNTSTGEIISSYCRANIHDESRSRQWIKIDTAPYLLSDKATSFGIKLRLEYVSTDMQIAQLDILSIFEFDGKNIKQVVDNLLTHVKKWPNMQCHGNYVSAKRILVLDETNKSHGHKNILLKDKFESYKVDSKCMSDNKRHRNSEVTLKFNGEHYDIPPEYALHD